MAEKTYVCLYSSYLEDLAPFTDEELGRLMKAMILYGCRGKEPELSGREELIWPSLRSQIQRDLRVYEKRCEKNRENGRKGGRPRGDSKTDGFSEEPKKAKEKEKEKKNDKDKDRESIDTDTAYCLPPSLEQVEEYCKQKGIHISPKRFVNYYNAVGWQVGHHNIKDWKAVVNMWGEKNYGENELYDSAAFGNEI